EGAGAEMRKSLGTAVFSGMLGVTLFGIFLTPVFYFVIMWLAGRHQPVPVPVVATSPEGDGKATPEAHPAASSEHIQKLDPAGPPEEEDAGPARVTDRPGRSRPRPAASDDRPRSRKRDDREVDDDFDDPEPEERRPRRRRREAERSGSGMLLILLLVGGVGLV